MDNKLLTQLRILKMTDSKPNFSELSRIYNIDRRTIKKYYDGYEGKSSSRNKPSKLDKYEILIRRKLMIKGTTIKSVYEYIYNEIDVNLIMKHIEDINGKRDCVFCNGIWEVDDDIINSEEYGEPETIEPEKALKIVEEQLTAYESMVE